MKEGLQIVADELKKSRVKIKRRKGKQIINSFPSINKGRTRNYLSICVISAAGLGSDG